MSLNNTNLNLSIKSIEDLMRCINLASLLELSGWPKPGNVHRTKNYENTKFEHFLAGIAAIQPNFREFCERISQLSFKNNNEFREIKLGLFFKKAAKEMMRWQSGGNVLLGHILILSPLVAAATICLKKRKTDFNNFKFYLSRVINKTTVDDTVNLYKAIRLCNPGGLGKVEKYDINDDKALENIRSDNIKLKKIFELSKDYDLISREYSTNFRIILSEGFPYFLEVYNTYKDPNIAIVNTFLKILSIHPDTLIIRKSGLDSALYVSKLASKILDFGGISSQEGFNLSNQLDIELHEKRGKMNPGTTADLISGVILCALLFGLRI
ncbi:MAG: triphosphoribosyl-dephospho-CoA synthase [Promethearchaeota archaeon]